MFWYPSFCLDESRIKIGLEPTFSLPSGPDKANYPKIVSRKYVSWPNPFILKLGALTYSRAELSGSRDETR